jgi:glycosyl transferase family 87
LASRRHFRRLAVEHGFVLVGIMLAVWQFGLLGDWPWLHLSDDVLAYRTVDLDNPYAGSHVGGANAYLYSPAFAQALALLRPVPTDVFVALWAVALLAITLWLARPWPLALLALIVPISQEIAVGQIHLLLVLAIVLGFRWPAAWAVVLLTKVTPGIGLLWFGVRQEWRHLAIALVATVGVVLASFAVAPQAWFDWIALLAGQGGGSLVWRLGVAAALVAWGAQTDRPWTVPLAAFLALPVVWMDSFVMLLGCVALAQMPATSAEVRSSDIAPIPAAEPATSPA